MDIWTPELVGVGLMAYLDPGLGSMVLQVVVGAMLGASFVFRQSIRRLAQLVTQSFRRKSTSE